MLFLILPLAVSLALLSIGFSGMVPARIQAYFAQHEANEQKTVANATSLETLMENCYTHEYTTEIISLDPLVIYINNFTSAEEAEELIKLG